MKVLKFGGTSMGSAESLKKVAIILKKNKDAGIQSIVTCSAMSGVTNLLIEMGHFAQIRKEDDALKLYIDIRQKHIEAAEKLGVREEFEDSTRSLFQDLQNLIRGIGLIREFSERSKAYLLSFGERFSTRILDQYLNKSGISSQQYDSNFIKTVGLNFTEDEVDWDNTCTAVKTTLKSCLDSKKIPVITGFFGTNNQGVVSLLGRGGSDFTGAILSVCLEIPCLEIWTDVDGFLTADPRIVKNARIIEEISFQEASELCFYGAKVLHPKTIRPVIDRQGEVWIKNTFAMDNPGTKITEKAKENKYAVISISSKKVGVVSLDLFATQKSKRQILSELFALTEQQEIYVDMIASSEAEVSFCIEERHLDNENFLQLFKEVCPFYYKKQRTVLCIVSPKDVTGQIGVAGRIFTSIAESGVSVEMYSQNASEIAQLIVVKSSEAKKVIKNLHDKMLDMTI